MNMQAIIDAMNESGRLARSDYHLTLGSLISKLGDAIGDEVVAYFDGESPGREMSYRGYYSDLSFSDADDEITAKEFLNQCNAALGETYEGYKGGDFKMTEDTPLWRSAYGESSGLAIMDLIASDGRLLLVTKRID